MTRAVDCTLFTAEPEDATHEGCPIVTKRRHVVVDKGVAACVQWEIRWPDGQVADFSECFESSASESESSSLVDPTIRVRFGDGCNSVAIPGHVVGEMVDAANGIVSFCLPAEVYNSGGLYQFQIAINDGTRNFFMDKGLISVEPGLFGDITQTTGPPSMQEIRIHMRDTAIENDLLGDVEFDDAEILFAISRPIQQWNETPPPIARRTCQNFPFRYHWLNAIVGELMLTALHHYTRNKMKASAGGLTEDDKNKDMEYTRLAQRYQDEWRHFIVTKKVQLNVARGFDSMGSDYDFRW